MSDTMDFDQFITEVESEGIPFKAFGKEYKLPATVPLGLVMKFRALGTRKQTDQLTEKDMLDIVEAVFGREIIEELMVHSKFDVPYMLKMLTWAFDVYGLSPKEPTVVTETVETTVPTA